MFRDFNFLGEDKLIFIMDITSLYTCSCPTELISSYLDKIMAPIVRSLTSYVKDSQHALQILSDFNFLGEDKLIFTMDIASLYTVIPNADGLLALKHFLIYALLRDQVWKHCSAWQN